MAKISTADGTAMVTELADIIINHKEYLSEIDGAIGDGDHGINMAKGFSQCKNRMAGQKLSLAEAFDCLSEELMNNIGGSMGPLYGSIFMGMAEAIQGQAELTAKDFATMLDGGLNSLRDITTAQPGDKCLLDALVPAIAAFKTAVEQNASFADALQRMVAAAEQGRDSTKDMISKIGRSSRLGERSRGVLDAGASSCCLLLTQLADSAKKRLQSL